MTRKKIFLENRSYRLRRAWDALKMLPFLGLVLWSVPLLWQKGESTQFEAVSTASALYYIFAVWVLLIVLCFGLWWPTSAAPNDDGED